jgi:phage tail-like protein
VSGTSWLLGSGYPWHSADPPGVPGSPYGQVVANQNSGLSLATLPKGPLGLLSAHDTLGRLTLPRGVAVDGDLVLVLSRDGSRVYRYDAVRATLAPLPQVGAEGLPPDAPDRAFAEPRRFRGATNIAVHAGLLYVADPAAHRVQVFDVSTLALVRIHGGLVEPVDLASGRDGVYIVDPGAGRIYVASPPSDTLAPVVNVHQPRWTRIAVDRTERLYLLVGKRLDVFSVTAGRAATRPVESFDDPGQVRDRFPAQEIDIDARGGILLPPRLLDPCRLRAAPDPQMKRRAVGERIYEIDPGSRMVLVRLADGRVRHRFGPYDARGRAVKPDVESSWSPVEILSIAGCVLILDERHRTVYAHRAGSELLQTWFTAPSGHPRAWRRLADDGTGCLLLWDGIGALVDRVDQRGRLLGTIPAREVRARFTAPETPPSSTVPMRLTRDGAVPVNPRETPQWRQAAFQQSGTWISAWLDSDLYNCQWHLIEVSVADLPPGSRLVVRTRTSNKIGNDAEMRQSAISTDASGAWREVPPMEGPAQPAPCELKPRTVDILVPNPPGQFIQLQIALSGDATTTPVVTSVRLRFPRESWLQYLPAIFSKPDDQREFLDRLLSIVQTTWSGIEREVDSFERFLDPDSVPPEAMDYLAGWLDLTLEGRWVGTPAKNRRLLQAMPHLWRQWGTPQGLRAWLRVYLANLADVEPEALERDGIPGIVESFVDRRRLLLNRSDTAALCTGAPIWGPGVERRFQVNVFDRVGEVELVSAGEPALDVFRHYAHSFRVYVPAAWIRTPDDEALIRRAIELQKPAHTTYELVLVEPRFRIGEQSTIDLDTVIAAPLTPPLGCALVDDAPGRPVYQRLGFDMTLGGQAGSVADGALERRLP